jgi:hypothetical protein
LGDRIEEGTQRKGAEARRLAENGGRLSAEWCVGMENGKTKRRRALREPWVPRSRKVVERQLCGSSQETPEAGGYRPWGFLQKYERSGQRGRDLSKEKDSDRIRII